VVPSDDQSGDAEDGAFDRVKQCLKGGPRIPLDHGSSKMLLFVVGGQLDWRWPVHTGTDVEITDRAFVVHFSPQRKRVPSSYYRSSAPPVVSELMTRANLRMVTGSVVVGLPAGHVPAVRGNVLPELTEPPFPAWSYGPKLVWIAHDTDTVRLVVHPSAEPWRRPWSLETPDEGALALPPELPFWTPEAPAFALFGEPMACPQCRSTSSRYRQIDERLICPHCGSSFRQKREQGDPVRPA
jgi:hypothetical protein